MQKELIVIKKKFGENMEKLCRKHFQIILEDESFDLADLLLKKFAPSKFLYNDIMAEGLEGSFRDYIFSFYDKKHVMIDTGKSPEELLDEAGYNLFECKSEEDIQSFKHYFAKGERICTFDGDRLLVNYVYFAVKKDVDKIKREDFLYPERQDLYGTSVISIQFTKDFNHCLLITNRYNHHVLNSDVTFNANLDNIIPGLTASFSNFKGMTQSYCNSEFELSDYIEGIDKRQYRLNAISYGCYCCSNNIVIYNNQIKKLEPEQYLLLENYVIDYARNKITSIDKFLNKEDIDDDDSFLDSIGEIENINKTKIKEENRIEVVIKVKNGKDIIINANLEGNIIGYINNNVEVINDDFLISAKYLEYIEMKNVKRIGKDFIFYNENARKILLPNVIEIDNTFLSNNICLKEIIFPNLKKVGCSFLEDNTSINYIELPNVLLVGDNFLSCNSELESINFEKLRFVGNRFLCANKVLKNIDLPSLETTGSACLTHIDRKMEINVPNLDKIGYLSSPLLFRILGKNDLDLDLPLITFSNENDSEINNFVKTLIK